MEILNKISFPFYCVHWMHSTWTMCFGDMIFKIYFFHSCDSLIRNLLFFGFKKSFFFFLAGDSLLIGGRCDLFPVVVLPAALFGLAMWTFVRTLFGPKN